MRTAFGSFLSFKKIESDVVVTINRKGKAEFKTKKIVSNLLLSPFQLASLKKLAEPEFQAPASI